MRKGAKQAMYVVKRTDSLWFECKNLYFVSEEPVGFWAVPQQQATRFTRREHAKAIAKVWNQGDAKVVRLRPKRR